ncbi:MAG: electron transfer flavoprotein subunit beta/FixA family protein [Gammaproteobacteria bacterium]|nr:electron transfer flavoprotein subunit beta/FixA family protein [Gammaproteobacteria bacterium]
MKILVAVKRVLDFNLRVRLKPDGSGVDLANAKMSMNPFDEIAVEEAIRLKEKGVAGECVAVSIGPLANQETLRTALALGMDRGILITTDEEWEPLNVAKILKKTVEKESPQLVILGKQSIDGDHNQTGQMLAEILNWPQATCVSELKWQEEECLLTREIDTGLEVLAVKPPFIMTVDLRLNQPRYATLPNIMRAKQKPLSIEPLLNLNNSLTPRIKRLKVEPPPPRNSVKMLKTVEELVRHLKQEAKVI